MNEMVFDFTRYFILADTKNAYKIQCSFDDINITVMDILDMRLPANKIASVITHLELSKFLIKASAIIYGKFADNDTPNYDLIKSFIELCEMFEIPILLNQKIYSDVP